jgi:hypothetical protein
MLCTRAALYCHLGQSGSTCFPTLSKKLQDFQKKSYWTWNMFWFSLQNLSLGRVAQSVQRLVAQSVPATGSSVGSEWLRAGRSGDRIQVGARFFAHVQTGPEAHPASCTMGTGCLPGVKRPGRGADHPSLLAPRSRMSTAITLLPL